MQFVTQSGTPIGLIGQGTWYLGEHLETWQQELFSLRTGLDQGMTLVDTAEMYGDGAAERLVGQAIQHYDREKLYLVSKVYPHNAGRKNIRHSCQASLKRMGTDYLDLYLLHWRGSIPLAETVECMEQLMTDGLIREWGVSNLDLDDMKELLSISGGSGCRTDQVLYHLGSRGIEYDLLPFLRKKDIPVMAYCPLAQAGQLRNGLMNHPAVLETAQVHNATPAQILLSFLLTKPGVIPIPRASKAEHTLENAKAADLRLTREDLKRLDEAFPAPSRRVPLDMQ